MGSAEGLLGLEGSAGGPVPPRGAAMELEKGQEKEQEGAQVEKEEELEGEELLVRGRVLGAKAACCRRPGAFVPEV